MFIFDPQNLPGAWNVWCHPKRYANLIAALCDDKSSDADRISSLEKVLDGLRREAAAVSTEKTDLATRLVDKTRENEDLRRQIECLKARLEEAGDIESKLDEFSLQLEGIERMKKNYEDRIRTLRLQLRDARSTIKALSGEDIDNELSALVTPGAAPAPPEVYTPSPSAAPAPADTDLEDTDPKPIIFGQPDSSDHSDFSDTDWLRPLPKNI